MRVVALAPFDREFFGGRGVLELHAETLFGLVAALDTIAPGFAEVAQARAAFAVDGVFAPNWSKPLAEAAEVVLLPRIAGG